MSATVSERSPLTIALTAAVLSALLCVLTACAGSNNTAPAVAESRSGQAPPQVAQTARRDVRDLALDEQRGGHTLRRHVGQTDADLAARLARERDISAASTYSDRETAETVVAAALADSKPRLDEWLTRSGARPNLVLRFSPRERQPIGRSLARRGRKTTLCYRALVVLRWDNRLRDWYVLTSYPEAGR